MFTLFHHPFCPHSRFIRLVLGEYGLDLQLAEERPWERREEFLILNPDFPRSIRFGASRIQASLKAIAALTGRGGRAERLAGRLLASLDYGQVDEIVGDQLPAYLEGIVRQSNQINAAVYQQYIDYPIDAALSA